MRINADFSQRAVVRPGDVAWVPSPMAGVERIMLDRIGDEVARATSIVRYAPGSHFSAHQHSGGEEFLVLEGTFSDEHADYPAGTYVRNPIGTSHVPRSEGGCTILVKLHQFDADDREQKAVAARPEKFVPGDAPGVSVFELHSHGSERVCFMRFQPRSALADLRHSCGAEFYVVEGAFADGDGSYPQQSWLRMPRGSVHDLRSDDGCLLWVKTGHLGTN
jgi:anti-sigma factor ChrR (cupin superfamily)